MPALAKIRTRICGTFDDLGGLEFHARSIAGLTMVAVLLPASAVGTQDITPKAKERADALKAAHIMRLLTSPIIRFYVALLLLVGLIACSAYADTPAAAPAVAPPRLLVEGWLDREGVSDLYIYDLAGKREKRLTDKPLPTCVSQAISPDGHDVAFVANAGALHVLSVKHHVLSTLHAGRTGAVAFSHDSSAAAFVVLSTDRNAPAAIRVKPVRAGSPIGASKADVLGEVRDLEFTPTASPSSIRPPRPRTDRIAPSMNWTSQPAPPSRCSKRRAPATGTRSSHPTATDYWRSRTTWRPIDSLSSP